MLSSRKFNEPYEITPEDFEILVYLLGPDAYRVSPSRVVHGYVRDPADVPRSGTVLTDDGNITIFMAEENLPTLVHEYGHATHARKYPESEHWPYEKAEAFAFMSDIRAMKQKKLLSFKQRQEFAKHIRACRRDGLAAHTIGMKLAWRAVWGHKKRKDQEAAIVNG